MAIQALVIRGDFTADEFKQLVELIRRFDEANPSRTVEVAAVDPDKTALETAEAVLRDAIPPMAGHVTTFRRWPRQ